MTDDLTSYKAHYVYYCNNFLSDAQDFREKLKYCSKEENAFLRRLFKIS